MHDIKKKDVFPTYAWLFYKWKYIQIIVILFVTHSCANTHNIQFLEKEFLFKILRYNFLAPIFYFNLINLISLFCSIEKN